jgi:hypothetical protein
MKGLYKLGIKTLIVVCVFILSVGFLRVVPAYALECNFQTSAAYYDSTGNPGEELSFKWDKDSGKVTDFSWLHQDPESYRIPFAADPGQVNIKGHVYSLNIGATTQQLATSGARDSLIGYLSPRIVPTDDYALAGFFEGTGSAWLVANGKVSPPPCLFPF